MNIIRYTLQTLLVLFLFTYQYSPAIASPWPQSVGEGIVITRLNYFQAGSDGQEFTQTDTNTYLEYGVTQKITFGGQFIYGSQNGSGVLASYGSGLLAADIFVQNTFQQHKNTSLSGRLKYSAPVSLTMVSANGTPRVEGRDAALSAGLLYGASQERERPRFVTLEAGYRYSLGEDSDALRADITYGVPLDEYSTLYAKLFNYYSMDNGDIGGENYSTSKVELSWVRAIGKKYSIEIGAGADIVTDNTAAGHTAFISVWDRF